MPTLHVLAHVHASRMYATHIDVHIDAYVSVCTCKSRCHCSSQCHKIMYIRIYRHVCRNVWTQVNNGNKRLKTSNPFAQDDTPARANVRSRFFAHADGELILFPLDRACGHVKSRGRGCWLAGAFERRHINNDNERAFLAYVISLRQA
jgi:hypothetical protein